MPYISWITVLVCIVLALIALWAAVKEIRKVFFFKWECSSCHREELISRNPYCTECAHKMMWQKKKIIRCPMGHQVQKENKYCGKCGSRIYMQ